MGISARRADETLAKARASTQARIFDGIVAHYLAVGFERAEIAPGRNVFTRGAWLGESRTPKPFATGCAVDVYWRGDKQTWRFYHVAETETLGERADRIATRRQASAAKARKAKLARAQKRGYTTKRNCPFRLPVSPFAIVESPFAETPSSPFADR